MKRILIVMLMLFVVIFISACDGSGSAEKGSLANAANSPSDNSPASTPNSPANNNSSDNGNTETPSGLPSFGDVAGTYRTTDYSPGTIILDDQGKYKEYTTENTGEKPNFSGSYEIKLLKNRGEVMIMLEDSRFPGSGKESYWYGDYIKATGRNYHKQ